MAVPTAYLTSTKNVVPILEAARKAGVPDRFTHAFMKQLGFASSGDRPIIPVLKALGFLDENGTPTDRYRRFKDEKQGPFVLAEALRDAYSDVFAIDQKAHSKTHGELKGIFARLSDKGDSVVHKMASTFKAFADIADFSGPPQSEPGLAPERPEPLEPSPLDRVDGERSVALYHDVHIHLPATTDINVYHAIFKSVRENLI